MKTKFQIEKEISGLEAALNQSINLHCPENVGECSKTEGWKEALEWVLADEGEINKQIKEIENKLALLKATVKNVIPKCEEMPF